MVNVMWTWARREIEPGTSWEQVDMDRSTVLDSPSIEGRRRTGTVSSTDCPLAGADGAYLKMLLGSPSLRWPMLEIGLESLGWAWG
jgi:hypothetical protein